MMSDAMKEKISKLALAVFAVAIVLFSVLNTPSKTEIKQDVALDIYENGMIVGETAVHMDGVRVEYLMGKEDDYVGCFAIDLAERTCSEHTSVQIIWLEDGLEHQNIMFFNGGDFFADGFGVNNVLLINPDMTEMAIQMTDGRVLASSEKVYDIYMEYFTYNAANGTTGIASGIPAF